MDLLKEIVIKQLIKLIKKLVLIGTFLPFEGTEYQIKRLSMLDKNKEAYIKLGKFIGTWNTEGLIPASNNNPEVKVIGTDTYEWIVDGFFLLHTANVTIGNEISKTHEIIGYDAENEYFTMQHYNNKGSSGCMIATFNGNEWSFKGDNLRFKGGFNEHGDVFSGAWEQLTDATTWAHLMKIKLSKK